MSNEEHEEHGPFGLSASDDYGKHWLKMMVALKSTDAKTRDRASFAIAEEARKNLHRLKPKVVPTRPAGVPCDDDILHAVLDQKKAMATTPRARMLAMYGAWRMAVQGAEGINAGSIMVAARAILTFRRLKLPKQAAEMEQFLEDEYDARTLMPDNLAKVDQWATNLARRMDVLSWELRNMERRPRQMVHSNPQDEQSWANGLPELPEGADPFAEDW